MKKNNKKSKNYTPVTLENLAYLLKRGFIDADKRFDKLEEKSNTIESKIESIETLVDNLAVMTAKGFEATHGQIADIDKRLILLREEFMRKLDGTNTRIDDLSWNRVKYEQFEILAKKVTSLEHKLVGKK